MSDCIMDVCITISSFSCGSVTSCDSPTEWGTGIKYIMYSVIYQYIKGGVDLEQLAQSPLYTHIPTMI